MTVNSHRPDDWVLVGAVAMDVAAAVSFGTGAHAAVVYVTVGLGALFSLVSLGMGRRARARSHRSNAERMTRIREALNEYNTVCSTLDAASNEQLARLQSSLEETQVLVTNATSRVSGEAHGGDVAGVPARERMAERRAVMAMPRGNVSLRRGPRPPSEAARMSTTPLRGRRGYGRWVSGAAPASRHTGGP